MNKKNLTYKKSGVNITAADKFVKYISLLNTVKIITYLYQIIHYKLTKY